WWGFILGICSILAGVRNILGIVRRGRFISETLTIYFLVAMPSGRSAAILAPHSFSSATVSIVACACVVLAAEVNNSAAGTVELTFSARVCSRPIFRTPPPTGQQATVQL